MPLIFRGLVLTVIVAPLPFAAAPTWAWSALALIVGVLVVWWSLRVLFAREMPVIGWSSAVPVALPFGLAALWAALQASALLPAGWQHPLWDEAAAALHANVAPSVTLDRFATGSALTRLLAYGGIFWLALHYGRLRRRADAAMLALALAGSCYALYGLAEFFGGNRILGYEKQAYIESLTSTFINRNNYATFTGLTLLCTTGLLVPSLLAAGRRPAEVLTIRNSLLMSGWMFQCTALYLTGSRAGIACSLLGLAVLLAATLLPRWETAPARAAVAIVCGAALLAGFWQSGALLMDRLAVSSQDLAERQKVYQISAGLIAQRPLLGTGYGTFEDVFRIGRDASIGSVYEKAHDTYIEDALELGIPAASLLWLGIGAASLGCVRGLRAANPGRIFACIGVGGTALVATHALFDFSLQIPAVAACFALLLGVALGQSLPGRSIDAVGEIRERGTQ